jgi:seryl-tRNA synthetase
MYGAAAIQLSLEDLRRLILERQAEAVEEGHDEKQDQILSLEEVRKKIEEAVEFTRREEEKKYKNSLDSLNNQLNVANKKIDLIEDQLRKKDIQLDAKDKIIEKLYEDYAKSVEGLKSKVSDISNRIFNIPSIPTNKHDLDRPGLKDGVFIDPSDNEVSLDSHIEADVSDSSITGVSRDIKSDLSKLKVLLSKSKEKPI